MTYQIQSYTARGSATLEVGVSDDVGDTRLTLSWQNLVAVAFSAMAILRWGRLPIRPSAPSDSGADGRWPSRLAGSLRALGPACSAGMICGVLVAGFLGRFVMRVLVATSGDGAKGLLTDADEVVGEITLSGSIAFVVFVVFVGLGAGAVAALVLLVARPCCTSAVRWRDSWRPWCRWSCSGTGTSHRRT